MIDQVVRSVPKKKKHNRIKKKAKDRGRITPQVYEEVSRRSGGLCEWCGNPPKFWLQKAHLQSRAQLGRGDIPWNIADLCGPSDKKGTCHWELDPPKEIPRLGATENRRIGTALRQISMAGITAESGEIQHAFAN